MDAYEATKVVLSRIQSIDPQNASKIMGYILIQDQGENDMIRLAFGPETVLISLINQAKFRLGLSSDTSSAPPLTPSHSSPFTNGKFNPFHHSPPRIIVPNNGFSSAPSSPWSSGSHHHPVFSRTTEASDEDDVFLGGSHHDDDEDQDEDDDNNGGFGSLRPCMYYARGFCKNGNSCRFVHGGYGVNSHNKVDYFDEVLRMKVSQQQRYAQFMASGGHHHHHHHPFAYNKCMNILNDNQRSAAAALMMRNEFHKYGRSLPDRNEFLAMALDGNSNSSLRQIYLTFPADSTFKEEDVSNYFSMYGPVQDVRIPYQQKRMFGFVTFVYAETVRLILAKGNPHFVCDSRVLVKPYKEKGKILDKKQHQLSDRGELSACLSPRGLESGEFYDTPFGARMFYNSRELMLRRRMDDDAELQQSIDLQGRRLMNMQMTDMKNPHQDNYFQSSLSPGASSAFQLQHQYQNSQGLVCSSNGINQEVIAEENGVQEHTEPPGDAADEKVPLEMPYTNNGNGTCIKEQASNSDESDLQESFEHILPDNLFASPKKSAAEQHVAFSSSSAEANINSPISAAATATSTNDIPMLPAASTFNMASVKSCYFQMPRFVSGQEATET